MRATLLGFLLLASACGGSSSTPINNQDAGSDAGSDAGQVADCVTNPTTSLDLLNGCTDAGFFDRSPVLPLLQADGGLPPLP
jgi:hypothetical protein